MTVIQYLIDLLQDPRTAIADWINTLGAIWVYAPLFLVIFIETGVVVMPFLPGDSLLFAAGVFAADGGGLSLLPLLLTVWCAAILGDQCNFAIGHFFGQRIVRSGKVKSMTPERIAKTEALLEKYGPLAIFLGRFFPFIRTFVPFFGGMGGMHWSHFVVWNVLGGITWSTIFTLLGYFFGGVPFVQDHFEWVIILIVLISVIPAAVGAVKAWLSSRKKKRAGDAATSETGAFGGAAGDALADATGVAGVTGAAGVAGVAGVAGAVVANPAADLLTGTDASPASAIEDVLAGPGATPAAGFDALTGAGVAPSAVLRGLASSGSGAAGGVAGGSIDESEFLRVIGSVDEGAPDEGDRVAAGPAEAEGTPAVAEEASDKAASPAEGDSPQAAVDSDGAPAGDESEGVSNASDFSDERAETAEAHDEGEAVAEPAEGCGSDGAPEGAGADAAVEGFAAPVARSAGAETPGDSARMTPGEPVPGNGPEAAPASAESPDAVGVDDAADTDDAGEGASDTGDASDTVDTAETGDTADTDDMADTGDTADTVDAADTGDASDADEVDDDSDDDVPLVGKHFGKHFAS